VLTQDGDVNSSLSKIEDEVRKSAKIDYIEKGYIVAETSSFNSRFKTVLSDAQINSYLSNGSQIYWSEIWQYKNLANQKKYEYFFLVKFYDKPVKTDVLISRNSRPY
jgi:hypothetical protein